MFPKKMFASEIRGRLNFAYSYLSADLTREEFIGHVITGNTYTNGISKHIVESAISMVMIEPQFIIYPTDEYPLSTFTGLQFGIPVSMNYLQEERLISPDFGTYENGQTTRGHSDGDIPLPSSLYFALSLGARYELYKFGNFSILPELRFNLGLTNLTEHFNWKASSLSIGAVLQYNPAITKQKPPTIPPQPVLPKPPVSSAPELAIKVFNDGYELKNGDTLKVKVIDSVFIKKYFVSPLIFFHDNVTEIRDFGKIPDTQEEAQKLSLIAVKNYLENNPDAGVTIISSSIEDDDNDVITKINENVVEQLNIDEKRVKQKSIIKKNKYKYPELENENRYIKFEFGNNKQELIVHGDTIVKSSFDNIVLEIVPKIKSEGEYDFKGQIKSSAGNKIELNEAEKNYKLNEILSADELKKGIKLSVIANVKDKSSQEAKAELEFILKPEAVEKVVIENSVNKDGANFTEYILGFCEFGKADFYSVNQHALEFTKNAIKDGKTIEILPLTDSLGTTDYNKNLANKRAEAALKILSINKNNSNVIIPDKYFFSNSTPEGRLLNRSVLVRIH
ncbi:MAG: hypothetical protein A2X61_12200 [Ignavibacteria bacterium GWB2_35_12]|nr:MAG: hypothetical protein A2X63_06485 [Ignavibacteria bacterium GWA2_35_8]OGU42528.1 MAG: hypothetical protein A2X61_12200 [Ignavibacteria bacterium GWB2_35_12]OGU94805.1 MAG: hypothetical protein A2220_11430 [Ignavibacteria bacterium RIFOXYA2_FULL_35_10]OGV19111.1 MAG: hypothetical protein A2475_00995 [Ignavibacteria bacterium RIFOXYC2_FULL_35_21]